jgi:hypothetical protein
MWICCNKCIASQSNIPNPNFINLTLLLLSIVIPLVQYLTLSQGKVTTTTFLRTNNTNQRLLDVSRGKLMDSRSVGMLRQLMSRVRNRNLEVWILSSQENSCFSSSSLSDVLFCKPFSYYLNYYYETLMNVLRGKLIDSPHILFWRLFLHEYSKVDPCMQCQWQHTLCSDINLPV